MLKNNFMKIIKAAVAISITICIISVSSVNAGLMCSGATDWSGETGEGVTHGKCDHADGTYTQTRTVGTCVCTGALIFCTGDTHSQKRTRTVTQNMVDGIALELCNSENTECEDGVDTGYAACALICGGFLPDLAAVALCEGVCYLARSLDMSNCHDAWNECKFSCTISSWSYSEGTLGCLGDWS